MDCFTCRLPFDFKEKKQCVLPCSHSICEKCSIGVDLCPECEESLAPSEIRKLSAVRRNGPCSRVKAALCDLRVMRAKARAQNSDTKATVSKTLSLALEQLTGLHSQFICDSDTVETANSLAFRQAESVLLSQLSDGGSQRPPNALRTPAFVQLAVKSDFGAELVGLIAALKKALTNAKVVELPGNTAYVNRYVPVTETMKAEKPAKETAVRWVYEYRGTKKEFTPAFTAALERAYQRKDAKCELRDKLRKLIFEVDLRTFTSYRPGDTSCSCPVSREA